MVGNTTAGGRGHGHLYQAAPEQVEAQQGFGFTADNIKVRVKFHTRFTDHGMQVPRLFFLKVNNELQLETDLVFVRPQ